jgi:alkyl sulfatase BDS1-like metallo-beta-lactamase superfamily hydrolase
VWIVAPLDFIEESVSENVLAGNVMSRRASYMYGKLAGWGPLQGIGAGLGQLTSSGSVSLVAPTDIISETGQELTIDGLRIVFQHTPGAEAPAELCFYLPERRALCMAEIATHTLHNVYTLRGAKVRDAQAWSRHINDALRLFGGEADVVFASHHWPTWGNAAVVAFLRGQRDLYRYIHDETLRLANHGFGPAEIAEMIELPAGIAGSFANRGYYGSVSHDTKAVYTYYLGFFDGNPATLHQLPPVEGARKTVEYMGGAEAVLARARIDFGKGEYRWVAQAVNNVVFADPDNAEARALQADTLEQLGYQAENAAWRNFYLSAARELRDGVVKMATPSAASPDLVRAMTTAMILDYLGVRLNGPRAAASTCTFQLVVTDSGERFLLELGNGVLNHTQDAVVDHPTATISLTRAALVGIAMGQATVEDLVAGGAASIEGDAAAVEDFLGLLDTFEFWFNIATP